MQNTEFRTVIGSRLYSLNIPFHPGSQSTRFWREQIVMAGPIDHEILNQVLALEVYYCVSVKWSREDDENGREEFTTSQLGKMLNDRMAKARRQRELPARQRWKRAA